MDLGTYRVPSAHPLPKLRQRGQGNQLCEGTFEQAGDSTEADWRPLHDRALAELLPEGLPPSLAPCAGIAQQMIFHYMRACPDRAAAKAGEC